VIIIPCQGWKYQPKKDFPLDPANIKIDPERPRSKRRKDPHEDLPKKRKKRKEANKA